MKVFNISSHDLAGRRFNGFDAHAPLSKKGVETVFGSFWGSEANEEWTRALWSGKVRRLTAQSIRSLEIARGVAAKSQIWSSGITKLAEFKEADVIHLQIVHDHFLSLDAIRRTTENKPTVWTWHDFWPLTGHCTAPNGCARWAQGCGSCPNLLAPLTALRDKTRSEFNRKRNFLENLDADIHVSTRWMERQIRNSLPDESPLRIHQFPFGIDGETYQDIGNRAHIRRGLHISKNAFVVTARATTDPRKGFVPLLIALDRLSEDFEVVLVTVQDSNIAQKYTSNLRVIQLPWSNHVSGLRDFYALGDLFAMPSSEETFGMMALEAMSCSRPVMTIAGTATAEVVNLPDLELRRENLVESISQAVKWAIEHPEQMNLLGAASRIRATGEFSIDNYVGNLANLYRLAIERN